MTETLTPVLITTAFALIIYPVTFSIYKKRDKSRTAMAWAILLAVYVAINLLIAAHTPHDMNLIVGALLLLNLFLYPIFSSSILASLIPKHSNKRVLILVLGILSCAAFIAAFSLLFEGNY